MNELGVNNITKEGALSWWSSNRRRYQSGLANLIYRVTVCGEDYASSDEMNVDMSYICRVFNITAFGATKQQNRIKGRYRKYREYEDIQRAIAEIIYRYPDGFADESPRFDDLLKNYYIQKRNAKLRPETNSHEFQNSSYDLSGQMNSYNGTKSEGVNGIGNVLPLIGLVILIIFLVRGCGGSIGEKASSITNSFTNKYEFETFDYNNVMYAGNKKRNKPDGVCASIPMQSDGTVYTIGDYKGKEIDGYGIICKSDIPLQMDASGNNGIINPDEAGLIIKMGEMKESNLNGYGAVFDSSERTIVFGEYKKGSLKKYGCKVSFDENNNMLVEAVKGNKVKRQMKEGTYKGMTYYPEKNQVVIDGFEYTIYANGISMKAEGVDISARGTQWSFDMFETDSEEGIYVDYALGKSVHCKVTTDTTNGVQVNEWELPIAYGAE